MDIIIRRHMISYKVIFIWFDILLIATQKCSNILHFHMEITLLSTGFLNSKGNIKFNASLWINMPN